LGPGFARCASCALSVGGAIFRTLEQIAALPDALGRHACECDHPEMRRLPDGVFHCPACGSEVLPTDTHTLQEVARDGVIDAVAGDHERELAIWFITCGAALILTGRLAHWAQLATQCSSTPRSPRFSSLTIPKPARGASGQAGRRHRTTWAGFCAASSQLPPPQSGGSQRRKMSRSRTGAATLGRTLSRPHSLQATPRRPPPGSGHEQLTYRFADLRVQLPSGAWRLSVTRVMSWFERGKSTRRAHIRETRGGAGRWVRYMTA
jgi:hypothetical protein